MSTEYIGDKQSRLMSNCGIKLCSCTVFQNEGNKFQFLVRFFVGYISTFQRIQNSID